MATNVNFASSLNTQIQSRTLRGQPYTQVHVLCIHWDKNDLHPEEEIDRLRDCFEWGFNYKVASLPLPADHSRHTRLYSEIVSLVDKHSTTEDSLIIVYYAGHCGGNQYGQAEWQAFEKGEPTVQWHVAQQLLFAAKGDVLIVLDCCNASLVMKGKKEYGRFELLAACAHNGITPFPGPKSFTSFLEKELRKHSDSGVTVNALGSLLRENNKMTETPVTHDFARQSLTSIIIKRLDGLEDLNFMQKPSGYVLIRASLSGDVTAQQIAEWLKTGPPVNITSYHIEAAISNARQLQSLSGLIEGTQQLFSEGSVFADLPLSAKIEIARAFRALDTSLATSSALSIAKEHEGDSDLIKSTLENIEKASEKLCEAVQTSFITQNQYENIETTPDELWEKTGTREAILLSETISLSTFNSRMPHDEASNEIPWNDIELTHAAVRFNIGTVGNAVKCTDAILEGYQYDADPRTSRPYAETLRQMNKIAALLCHPKASTYHVLPCLGFYHDKTNHMLGVAFRAPPYLDVTKTPITLLELYGQERRVPLGHRIQLASALADAMNHFHIVGWVHKGIRSENIAFIPMEARLASDADNIFSMDKTFTAPQGSIDLAKPYLFGFEYMRNGDAGTNLEVDIVLERNIYRHPERWGKPSLRYEKYHDIYALGLVLIEIALWKNVATIAKIPDDEKQKQKVKAEDVQARVRKKCDEDLPHLVGQSFYKATMACLDFKTATSGMSAYEAQRYFQKEVLERLVGTAGKV